MTHVVCEPCFACKYTDCVVVCPVECFYEGEKMLYIHPDECIDCEACVPECPVEAIFHKDYVQEGWKPVSCVKGFHYSGTLSSWKIASTGHSGTHASQSMHSSGWMYRIFSPS